jgi:hypothetical protein
MALEIGKIYVNDTDNTIIGETGWYDTGETNWGALYRRLRGLYGGGVRTQYADMCETPDAPRPVQQSQQRSGRLVPVLREITPHDEHL